MNYVSTGGLLYTVKLKYIMFTCKVLVGDLIDV